MVKKNNIDSKLDAQFNPINHSSVSIDELLKEHDQLLDDALKLKVEWIKRRVDEARKTIDKEQIDNISAIGFLKQAQEIQQVTQAIQQFELYCNQMSEDSPFVMDFKQLIQSQYFLSDIYEKLLSYVKSDEFLEIKELSKNSLIHPDAISELYQTLYDIDIRHDAKGRLYLAEMIATVRFYCQEMEKDYAQNDQARFRDGLVRLLREYRTSIDFIEASTLRVLRTNMSYSGLGSLGVVTYNIQISRENRNHKPVIEPNQGQLALARAIHNHHGLFRHKCKKHESQKDYAWQELKEASTIEQQAQILRDLASDIRQQHQSKSKIGKHFGSIFKHSNLAKKIDAEAEQLELAVEKASL